ISSLFPAMIRVAGPLLSTSPPSVSTICANSTVLSQAEQRARHIWKQADAVCFDVDSTVCKDEAIDELAVYLGVGEEVATATRKAMNGSSSFRDALANRLDIMKPSREAMNVFAQQPPNLTDGITDLIHALHKRGTHVYLVSGGFRTIIEPVADILSIPHSRIYANELIYDSHGNYLGFDENEPTSASGSKTVGKAGVCGMLKKKHGYKNLVMVGDGATDLEAAPPADAFIGFGGNAIRAAVRDGADWFVTSFESLLKALH
ncbi:hypothetical protein PFISCL1PPCAC_14782, partial [Pristionchus fissidentatus]